MKEWNDQGAQNSGSPRGAGLKSDRPSGTEILRTAQRIWTVVGRVLQGNLNRAGCRVELCHAFSRNTDRAGGRVHTFLHEPSRPCNHPASRNAWVRFLQIFQPSPVPLFGFAAVKQEDQADGSRVLIFDSLRKSRFRKDWELRHDSSVFEPRE